MGVMLVSGGSGQCPDGQGDGTVGQVGVMVMVTLLVSGGCDGDGAGFRWV